MRIGVVSDTHGHVPYTLEAVRLLETLDVTHVLHCGDIGSTSIVPLFAAWPTHFVLGNVDCAYERELSEAIVEAGQTLHGRFGQLELEGRRIALLHGDDFRRLDECLTNGEWDVVCHGHTHEWTRMRRGTTLQLNPGALFRASPHSFAVLELPACSAEQVRL